ncbi:MAG: lytic murein transglycosylase B [Gammaproteobacteria bacterium]|nr:lytic murein transglycosylase B [Gammaproteobacteria bacterium]
MVVACVTVLLLYGPVSADYSARKDVRAYVDELVSAHGFGREALLETFASARHQPRIVEAMSRLAERTKKWVEYRKIFFRDERIAGGVDFWADNSTALESAEASFKVAPEYVVAIIGVETYFGRIMGSHRVLDALSTLAFDYPPRSGFFRNELTEFLLLAREEKRSPADLKGSYAGAMGYGQFIPSSYRHYAVDFDGDGIRDIWTNTTDAIGSVANYFARHGWRGDGEVVLRVTASGGEAEKVANTGLALNRTVTELRDLGVEVPDIDGDAQAALFRMELEDGVEYWLALHDFYVITRYNRSAMYALAVHQLSQAIKAGREASLARSAPPPGAGKPAVGGR